MKYLKILALAVIATVALATVAGSASATVLTSPAGTVLPVGTTIHAELSEGSAKLATSFGTIECTSSTIEGKTANAGGAAETVRGTISSLTWGGCTVAGAPCGAFTTLKGGEFETHATGGGNGTWTITRQEITSQCTFIGFTYHCVWTTTTYVHAGSATGGAPAKLRTEVILSRSGGTSGAACGSTGKLTATYKFTKPNPLFIS